MTLMFCKQDVISQCSGPPSPQKKKKIEGRGICTQARCFKHIPVFPLPLLIAKNQIFLVMADPVFSSVLYKNSVVMAPMAQYFVLQDPAAAKRTVPFEIHVRFSTLFNAVDKSVLFFHHTLLERVRAKLYSVKHE